MIENYQIMAYNELIGLLLVLMEKANDKFLQENVFQRGLKKTGQKLRSFFRTDEAGIISLDTLSENYVQSIIGYNMEESIRNTLDVLNKYSAKQSNFNNITVGELFLNSLKIAVISSIGAGLAAGVVSIPVIIIALLFFGRKTTGSAINSGFQKLHLGLDQLSQNISNFAIGAKNFAIGTGSALIAEAALLQATAGVFTAAALSYKVYKMYRGRKRAFLLKDIFKLIHITLFKNNNTHKFIDIKDKVTFFKILSEKEKEILLTTGSKIGMQTSDKELSEYLSHFLTARKARLESAVVEALAKGDPNKKKALKEALGQGKEMLATTKVNGIEMLVTTTNPMHTMGYDPTKSKIFSTDKDGRPLPQGWLRETQDGETWYHDPKDVAQWESPLKQGNNNSDVYNGL
jgi:uncharacterized membrane protein